MKKVLLTIAVLGTILLSACEKDETLAPAETAKIKADKGILCRGCADWDLSKTGNATTFSTVTYDGETDTVATKKPGNPKSNK
jgi:hypothetical protein